jgi:hypothetical protein
MFAAKKLLYPPLWVFSVFVTACKQTESGQNQYYVISGYVKDRIDQRPVPQTQIYAESVIPTIFGASGSLVASSVTNGDGYYTARVNPIEKATSYRLFFSKKNYAEGQNSAIVADLKFNQNNILPDLLLTPTTILKIHFKNISPSNENDFFYFGFYSEGTWGGYIKGDESCGSINASEARTWRGKDVCGITTTEVAAEQSTHVYWTVEKNGIRKEYSGVIFCKCDVVSDYYINY